MSCFMRHNLHKVALRIRQYLVLDCSACTVACFPVQRSIFRERTSTWRCFLPVRKYWTRSSFSGSGSSRWNHLHEIHTTPVKFLWEEGHHLFRAPTAKLVLALLLAWGWNIGNNVLFVRILYDHAYRDFLQEQLYNARRGWQRVHFRTTRKCLCQSEKEPISGYK